MAHGVFFIVALRPNERFGTLLYTHTRLPPFMIQQLAPSKFLCILHRVDRIEYQDVIIRQALLVTSHSKVAVVHGMRQVGDLGYIWLAIIGCSVEVHALIGYLTGNRNIVIVVLGASLMMVPATAIDALRDVGVLFVVPYI